MSDGDDDEGAGTGARTVAGVREHALRSGLVNEVHARPYERLYAPVQGSHLAMLSGVDAGDAEREAVVSLCRRYGAATPAPEAIHFSADLEVFRLRWERHTEFSTYTFFHAAPFSTPFAEPAIGRVPSDWLRSLPGELLVALHVALEPRESQPRPVEEIAALFAAHNLAGSAVAGEHARVWTDFRTHADGFGRILVQDRGLRSRAAGRLVQRLLEIETYRTFALLALPLARAHAWDLVRIDRGVADVARSIGTGGDDGDDQSLLDRLGTLAGEVEHVAAATNYRFSAARAYYELVRRRIGELREQREEGIQTVADFMDRRLAPAMRTCESTSAQIEQLSTRTARASNLLRTRVDIAVERQSRDLLESMDRRAHLQLRLQQTVEGLSIVVLSYYLVGLVNYGLEGLASTGVPIDVALWTGISIPVVVGTVLLGVQRMRRAVRRAEERIAGPAN